MESQHRNGPRNRRRQTHFQKHFKSQIVIQPKHCGELTMFLQFQNSYPSWIVEQAMHRLTQDRISFNPIAIIWLYNHPANPLLLLSAFAVSQLPLPSYRCYTAISNWRFLCARSTSLSGRIESFPSCGLAGSSMESANRAFHGD